MENLDEIDRKILQLMQENAKLTTKELADKIKLSPTPTFERLKRLEREGFIDHYAAVLHPEKTGNGLIAFCNIRLKQHSRTIGLDVMQAVQKIPEVTECYNISGDYDFMIKIYVRDMPHYQEFVLMRLGEIKSIGSLHSIFVIGEIKNSHAIPV